MFKSILKSLVTKKISVLFIIIQLSITIFLIFDMLTNFNVFSHQKRQIEQIVGNNKEKLLKIEFKDLYPSKQFSDSVCELQKYTNSLQETEYSGGYLTTNYIFNELKNNHKYRDISKKMYEGTRRGDHLELSDCLLLDKNIDTLMNLKISEGRTFTNDDFNLKTEEITPVIVGAKFKSIFKLGDLLSAPDNFNANSYKKFIVIGFLEENQYWLSTSDYVANTPINLDKLFIIPLNAESENNMINVTSKATSYFVYLKNSKFVDSLKLKLDVKAKELGLNIKSYTVDEQIENYKQENLDVYINIIITTSILIIMSIFTMISTILVSIQKRKHELGIRIIAGASISYIKKMFLGEIILITFISTLISVSFIIYDKYNYYTNFLKASFKISEVLDIKNISLLISILFIIILFSSYIPLRKIQKLQPKELIGGIE